MQCNFIQLWATSNNTIKKNNNINEYDSGKYI